ncbi:MAG: hypothetical protein M9920_08925 [Verrucomicrobiae bacterium]|nr:hypothetical protein [Verrucomicrobiae bacterium]
MNNWSLRLKAVFDWRKLIFVFPLVTLWSLPVTRAVAFIGYADGVYAAEQTINASNDVRYGLVLLATYLFCLSVEVVLCCLLARKSVVALLILLSMPVWIAIQIIRFKPEEVIVLIPPLNVLWPLKWNALALLLGLSVFAFQQYRILKLGNARTT